MAERPDHVDVVVGAVPVGRDELGSGAPVALNSLGDNWSFTDDVDVMARTIMA